VVEHRPGGIDHHDADRRRIEEPLIGAHLRGRVLGRLGRLGRRCRGAGLVEAPHDAEDPLDPARLADRVLGDPHRKGRAVAAAQG
jgi:hypothetical protein